MQQFATPFVPMTSNHYLDSPRRTFSTQSTKSILQSPPYPFSNPREDASQATSIQQVSANNSRAESKREILVFVNEQQGYSFCHPNWWAKTEPLPGQILFVSPRANPTQFCENISVVVEDLGNKEYDLQEYTRITIRELTKEPQCKIFHSAGISDSACSLICTATNLSGLRAHEVIYTGTHEGVNIFFKQIWTIVNSKAYVVTFTCEASKFQTCLPFTQVIMNSFRLLHNPQSPTSNSHIELHNN